MLGRILLVAASSHAGALDVSWTAPTTNPDGSALTTLALYRLYYGDRTSDSPCPGSTFVEVGSSSPVPQPSETVRFQLTDLTTESSYSVPVTAVDTDGNESACSDVASAIPRDLHRSTRELETVTRRPISTTPAHSWNPEGVS